MIRINISFVMLLSLLGWLLLMLVPYLSMRSFQQYSTMLAAGPPVIYQALGVSLFCGTVLLFSSRDFFNAISLDKLGTTRSLFVVFCIYTGILAFWSISPVTSMLFTILHLGVFGCFVVMWQRPEAVERFLPLLGFAVFAALVMLGIHLGFRQRTFGFMPPNDIAKLAMVGSVFCAFGHKRTRLVGMLIDLAFILVTQSRGTLIAFGIFWGLLWFTGRFGVMKLTVLLGGTGVACMVLISDQILSDGRFFGGLLDSIFLLDDAERGLGSGLTGRLDHWIVASQIISDNLLFGHGLRTRGPFTIDPISSPDFNAHSGYLNMILDIGLVGSCILLGLIIVNMVRRLREIWHGEGNERWRNQIAFSFLVAALFIWALEPIYINLGAPFSLVMLLQLASPLQARHRLLTQPDDQTDAEPLLVS